MKNEIYAVVRPDCIDMLTKLVEAYDNLGIVSTLDQSTGRVVIRVTPDTWAEVMDIMQNLPFEINIENHGV
jgi:hypothetical protein